MIRPMSIALATGALLASNTLSAQTTTIDTGLPGIVTSGPAFGLLRGPQAFAGQTFTVPAQYFLSSFSFTACCSYGAVAPTAWLYAWSGSGLSGPALFTGASSSDSPNSSLGLATHDFFWNVGGLALSPGAQYVAFLSNPTQRDALVDRGIDSYAGGTAVSGEIIPGPGVTVPTSWVTQSNDAVFQATFTGQTTTTPEPGTWLLVVTGLLGFGLIERRRRWKASVSTVQNSTR